MTPKKKGRPVRGGRPLDDVRPCRGEPILSAGNRRNTQEPDSFGTEPSTGPLEGPFSCPNVTHFCTQETCGYETVQVAVIAAQTVAPERHFADATLYVDSSLLHTGPRRTASPQGQTLPELQRLRSAATFLSKRGWRLAFITLAAHHLPESEARAAFRSFKSRVTDCQRRGGMKPGMYIEALETKVSTHSHLIVAGTPKVLTAIRRLAKSKSFAKLDDPETGTAFVKVQGVYDVDHLVTYLSKEATAWAAEKTGRAYQRHASKAIGDRVRLGKALEVAMNASGDLRPYAKTYATPTAAKVAKQHKAKPPSSRSFRRALDEPSTCIRRALDEPSTNPRRALDESSTSLSRDIPTTPDTAIILPPEATGTEAMTQDTVKRIDPTAADRQRRRRAKLKAERDSVTVTQVTRDVTVTTRDVTHNDEDYPSQGTCWATDDMDDSDAAMDALEHAVDAMHRNRTPATILDFQEARNRRFKGRWPAGTPSPLPLRYYDVNTGQRVA